MKIEISTLIDNRTIATNVKKFTAPISALYLIRIWDTADAIVKGIFGEDPYTLEPGVDHRFTMFEGETVEFVEENNEDLEKGFLRKEVC